MQNDTGSTNTIDIMMQIINWSSFPNVSIKFIYNVLMNFQNASIKKMMKSLDWRIENLFIQFLYPLNYIYESRENVYNYVISEYGMNIETYGIYKLFVNTNLIHSLNNVIFCDYSKVDFKFLYCLAERGGVSDLLSKIKFRIFKP